MNVPSKSVLYHLHRCYLRLPFLSSCCMEAAIFPTYPVIVDLFAVLAVCSMCSGLLVMVLILILEATELHYFSNLFW